MATGLRRETGRLATGAVRLSGRVMGQLGAAEQLVVWALREAACGETLAGQRLLEGFRLAFGERGLAAAVCGFDGMRRCLLADPARAPRFCPLRCACLAADEEQLLYALAAAQLGLRETHRRLVSAFVPVGLVLQLWRQMRLFGAVLLRVDLALPERSLVELEGAVTCH